MFSDASKYSVVGLAGEAAVEAVAAMAGVDQV